MSALEHSSQFDLLGVRLTIQSSDEELIHPFRVLLAEFRVSAEGQAKEPEQSCTIGLVASGQGHQHLWIDDTRFEIEGQPRSLVAHAYSVLFDTVFALSRDKVLIHGAVFAVNDQATILCGPSGFGKTTLSRDLCRCAGFVFLSDDVAAVDRRSGCVEAFPKALSIRPGIIPPQEVEGAVQLPVLDGQSKSLVSPRALGMTVAGAPLTLRRIVFLGNGQMESTIKSTTLVVAVHRCPDALINDLGQLDGLQLEAVEKAQRFPQLRVNASVPALALRQIELACRRHGALVIGSSNQQQRQRPDFSSAPQLRDLQLMEGVRRTIRNLWGTAQFESLDMSGARLFGEIARLLEGVEFKYLLPGSYQETLEFVQHLVVDD